MNYKHLHYFWTVARSGGVARAAERLHLTPQTISAQIKLLEDDLGTPLFQPVGRGLELTESGRLALGFADEIFQLGDALRLTLGQHQAQPSLPFRVGITDVVPKAIAYRLLEPAVAGIEGLRLLGREGKLEHLLAELALNRLDMVIADRPIPGNINVRGFSHALGASRIVLFAGRALAETCGEFPSCLDNAPMLMPGDDTLVRARLEEWLEKEKLTPRIVGEFDDDALLRAFGQAGQAFFPGLAVLSEEIQRQHGVQQIGEIDAAPAEYFAITGARRLTHPASRKVTDAAQRLLL